MHAILSSFRVTELFKVERQRGRLLNHVKFVVAATGRSLAVVQAAAAAAECFWPVSEEGAAATSFLSHKVLE